MKIVSMKSISLKQWKDSFKSKNTLIQNVILILVGTGINKALPFLLLPVLLHLLTPEDYGLVQNFVTLQSIEFVLIAFSSMGLLGVKYYALSRQELDKFIIASIIVSLATTLIILLLKVLFNEYLLHITDLSLKWQFASSLTAFMQSMILIGLQILRLKEKIKAYSGLEILFTVFSLSLSFLLILYFFKSWEGRVLGIVISNVIVGGVIVVILLKKHWFLKVDYLFLKEILIFGLPLIPHQLAWWARMGLEKFVITSNYGVTEVGIYSAASQFGIIIYILGSSFNKIYAPRISKELTLLPKSAIKKLDKETRLLIAIIIITVVFIGIASDFIYEFLPKSYIEGKSLVWPIVAANGLQCIYFLYVNYLFHTRKNKTIALITGITSILHILSLLAIVRFGSFNQIPYSLLLTNTVLVLAIYKTSLKAKRELSKNG